MIGRLKGIVLEKQAPYLLLEVGGVGYELATSMQTFYHLPDSNQEVTLYTHLVVREDAHTLYGFSHSDERTLFRHLIKVNGIGPKVALSILSSVEVNTFIRCIELNDSAQLIKIPGIGKKTAERLLIEMRDKLSSWQNNVITPVSLGISLPTALNYSPKEDAIHALEALGYKPQEAIRIINKITQAQPDLTSEQLIRLALQGMAQ